MISLILVLHTLLALLSCPPFALGVTLHLTQINFYPTVSYKMSGQTNWSPFLIHLFPVLEVANKDKKKTYLRIYYLQQARDLIHI